MPGPGDVKVNLKRFDEVMPDAVREAVLKRAAVHAIAIIQRRTRRGVDVEGAAFKAYSPKYARLKGGSGRRTSPVDLTLKGDMLNSMTVLDVNRDRALIGFEGSSTPTTFKRLRTKKGAATSRKTRAGRQTHSASARANGRPVANAIKAKAHNDGTGKVPRRHFFDLSPQERAEVIAEAAKTLRIGR